MLEAAPADLGMMETLVQKLQQALPAESSFHVLWQAKLAEQVVTDDDEELVVNTARHLIGQISARARSAEHSAIFAEPGTPPDLEPVVASMEALDIVLALWPRAGTQVLDFLGELNGTFQMLSIRAPSAWLHPLIAGHRTGAVMAETAIRLLLMIPLRCAGPSRLATEHVLELAGWDVGVAVAMLAAAFATPTHSPVPPAGTPCALARILHGLTLPQAIAQANLRGEGEDATDWRAQEFNSWQLHYLQSMTLAIVQFKIVCSAASAAVSSEFAVLYD